VDDERDSVLDAELFQQPVQIPPVFDEGVRRRSTVGKLGRITHANEVGSDASPELLHVRNDVAPQITRSRIAVQQHDRITLADVHVGHAQPMDGHVLFLKRERGAHHGIYPPGEK
jgi:hypothetical protein